MHITRLAGILRLATVLLAAAPLLAPPIAARAEDFFIPGQPKGQAAPRPAAPRTQQRAVPAPVQVAPVVGADGPDESAAASVPGPTPAAQMALPPVPDLPVLPKGASPPAAVIGVMGVPDVHAGVLGGPTGRAHAGRAACQAEPGCHQGTGRVAGTAAGADQ